MADNETIADIIAWLRKPIEGENAYLTLWRDEIADCIEAAHKRERGDAAKLREAVAYLFTLIDMRKLVLECDETEEISAVQVMLDECRAALSAPPRNCDIAQDWLHDLYANFKPPASVRREMPPEWVDAVMAFCRWLVAPATEKEGGAK